jgi:hypothetical protein
MAALCRRDSGATRVPQEGGTYEEESEADEWEEFDDGVGAQAICAVYLQVQYGERSQFFYPWL